MQASLPELLELKHRETTEVVDNACLFCKEVMRGKRRVLFDHFWASHSFHMGHPDNMIFIDELLALLRERLHVRFQCLHCDGTFQDYPTLRLHMRKKKHLQLRADCTLYDRFYLANYVHYAAADASEGDSDDESSSAATASSAADDAWDDWTDDASVAGVLCLFCDKNFPSSTLCVDHLRLSHQFDLPAMIDEWKLDFFARIKLINYVRRAVAAGNYRPVTRDDAFWNDYLFPAREEDGLLLHDYAPAEEIDTAAEQREAAAVAATEPPPEGLDELRELLEEKKL